MKLKSDNIYKALICFERLYAVMNDAEKRRLIEALVSEIQIYNECQSNGQRIKSIKFKFPIIEESMDICLDNDEHVECVVSMSKEAEQIGISGLTVRFVRVGQAVLFWQVGFDLDTSKGIKTAH